MKAISGEMPDSLKGLDWDDYQEIRFNKEAALWRDKNQSSGLQGAFFILV